MIKSITRAWVWLYSRLTEGLTGYDLSEETAHRHYMEMLDEAHRSRPMWPWPTEVWVVAGLSSEDLELRDELALRRLNGETLSDVEVIALDVLNKRISHTMERPEPESAQLRTATEAAERLLNKLQHPVKKS